MKSFLNSLFIASALMGAWACSDDDDNKNNGNNNAPNNWSADIDESFSGALTAGSGAFDIIEYNGKYLVSTIVENSEYNGVAVGPVFRINKDGSLDESFNSMNAFNGTNDQVYKMLKLSDGNILVVGSFVANNDNENENVAILKPDGSLDTSFEIDGTGPDGNGVFACAEDEDGNILVGGFIFSYNDDFDFGGYNIFKFSRSGAMDETFLARCNREVDDIKIQDGKIWVVGRFDEVNETPSQYVVVLNEDGSVSNTNTTLEDNGAFVDGAYGLDFQSDGKAIVVGSFEYQTESGYLQQVARFNKDLTLDETFEYNNSIATSASDWTKTVEVTSTDEIIIGGTIENMVGMLDQKGATHPNFTTPDIGFGPSAYGILIDGDKNIVVVGSFTSYGESSAQGIVKLKGM